VVDDQLLLQAAGTLTATGNGTALDLGAGFAPAGGKAFQVAIDATARDFTTGDETYKFKVQDSPDDATYTDRTPDTSLLAVGSIVLQGALHNRYVRLVRTLGGTTPSVTIKAVYLDPLVPR
jgi:hypothetical protein